MRSLVLRQRPAHLLAPHDPDRRLAGSRPEVRLLSRRLQVGGEEPLPHGGGHRGVRVPLAVWACLPPRGVVLGRRWGGATRVTRRPLEAPLGARVVPLEVPSVHDLRSEREVVSLTQMAL